MKEKDFLESIPAIAKFFRLGAVIETTAAGGDANANYFVETTRGSFFVKIVLEHHTFANKLNEVVYVNYAADSGVPCPPYLASRHGGFIYRDSKVMAMAQRRVAGAHPRICPKNVAIVAGHLGKMHQIPFSALPYRYGWFSPEYIDRNLARLRREFSGNKNGRAILKAYESCEGFVRNVLPNLPKSMIHGDAHSENVLFRGGQLIAFVDWEDSTIGPSLLDFAISVTDLCFPKGTFKPELYRAFYWGYIKESPLTRIEIEHINDCMRYVGVVQTMWRFLKFGRKAYLGGLKLNKWRAPEPAA